MATSMIKTEIKKITVSLTTNSNGAVTGSTGAIFGVENAHILAVYFERDSYGVTRDCHIYTFGNVGYELVFYNGSSPVTNSTVRATIFFTLL